MIGHAYKYLVEELMSASIEFIRKESPWLPITHTLLGHILEGEQIVQSK